MNVVFQLCAVLLGLMVVGCASLEGKITSSMVADLSGFAEQTMAVLGDPDPGFSKEQALKIREYLDPELIPELQRMNDLSGQGEALLDAIVNYSVAIATISAMRISEEQRIAEFAKGLRKLQTEAEILQMTDAQFNQIIAQVEAQSDFLQAIQRAQPVVNAVSRNCQLMLTDYENATDVVALAIDAAIEADFAPLREYQAWLHDARMATLGGLSKASDSAQTRYLERLESLARLDQEIEPWRQEHKARQAELDRLYAEALDEAIGFRVTMLVWARAHHLMADGVVDSADWFDWKDLGKYAFKLGEKAL